MNKVQVAELGVAAAAVQTGLFVLLCFQILPLSLASLLACRLNTATTCYASDNTVETVFHEGESLSLSQIQDMLYCCALPHVTAYLISTSTCNTISTGSFMDGRYVLQICHLYPVQPPS